MIAQRTQKFKIAKLYLYFLVIRSLSTLNIPLRTLRPLRHLALITVLHFNLTKTKRAAASARFRLA